MDAMTRERDDETSVMKDVALVGSDGGRVMATKVILAIQSPVFRRMFYGNFREADAGCDSVELDYCTPVLRVVVAYCYTPELELALLPEDDEDIEESLALMNMMVRDAAIYLELVKLKDYVDEKLKGKPVFVILKELIIRGETDGDLWSWCIAKMKQRHNRTYDYPFDFLETIFRSLKDEIPASTAHYLLYGCIDCDTEEKRSELQKFANDVDYEAIEICDLLTIATEQIEPCSLFPRDRFYNALANVASKPSCDLSRVSCSDLDDLILSWWKEKRHTQLAVRILKCFYESDTSGYLFDVVVLEKYSCRFSSLEALAP